MPDPLCHFAIHADDCDRARRFYGEVFGWDFRPWGPPGFWRVLTGQPGVEGALHGRFEPVSGGGVTGFECSISVADIETKLAALEAAGGSVSSPPFLIEGVGRVAKCRDTEGNTFSVMQYLPGVYDVAARREA